MESKKIFYLLGHRLKQAPAAGGAPAGGAPAAAAAASAAGGAAAPAAGAAAAPASGPPQGVPTPLADATKKPTNINVPLISDVINLQKKKRILYRLFSSFPL
jgi:hypothetical protein